LATSTEVCEHCKPCLNTFDRTHDLAVGEL
jgi:hypothetical protein